MHDERGRPATTPVAAELPVDPDLAELGSGGAAFPGPALDLVVAVAAGGFLGALARYGVGEAWPAPVGGFPWATFAINSSGALVLGALLVVLLERFPGARRARAFACTGFLGSWTTMSALAVDAAVLGRDDHLGVASAYVIATLVVGVAVGWLGFASAMAVERRRDRRSEASWSSP